MGCGNTKEQPAPGAKPEVGKPANYKEGAGTQPAPGAKPTAKGGDAKKDGASGEFVKAISKVTPVFGVLTGSKDKKYYVSFSKRDDTHLEVACATQSMDVHNAVLGEQELTPKKGELATWSDFIKSLFAAMVNKKVGPREQNGVISLQFATDGKTTSIGLVQHKEPLLVHKSILEPMCQWFAARRDAPEEKKFFTVEQELNTNRRKAKEAEARIQKIQSEYDALLQHSKSAADDAHAAKQQCDDVRKRLHNLNSPPPKLDLYPVAPTRYTLHSQHSTEHVPQLVQPNKNLLKLVTQAYQSMAAPSWRASATRKSALGLIREKYNGTGLEYKLDIKDNEVLGILEKVDDWDFDVIKLQELTGGGSLLFTTYTLMYKYGVVQHFKMDDQTLVSFLMAVQSAYHPNPYHNNTHAADVLQCTHYIINSGNLSEVIKMTPEDTLAALLAACIHDYDHPGLNNNFHIKTSAYLAILYNDRSVLENHHAAMVFDLIKNPQYNIFKSLSEDQKKEVRETMIEMVLSTDMGLHGKIFNQFQKRIQDSAEWSKKDDKYLALSIALKMADISNCARPSETYSQWSRMLADEFYVQGDAEERLGIPISPFMDRKKHDQDFPKGQISFMNYIVIPLYQAGAQFLSELSFTLKHIEKNVERWQKPSQ